MKTAILNSVGIILVIAACLMLCGLCETPAISRPPTLIRNVSERGDTPHQIIGNGFPDR